MANGLDEMNAPAMEQGRDANVIAKQIPVKVGWGSKFFDIFIWILPLPLIGGIIWLFVKINAAKYLRQLEQRINTNASEIDNYLEQRVMILSNAARLLDKAIDLDKDTMTQIAAYRGGNTPGGEGDALRNDIAAKMETVGNQISVAFERYPDLKAHNEIADALQQNAYLQREITAARTVYNDSITQWNTSIQEWPAKMIVAAKQGYTTRIPFITTQEIKDKARGVFF